MRYFLRISLCAVGIWCVGGLFGLWFQQAEHELPQTEISDWSFMLTDLNASKIILNNLLVITIALLGIFTGGAAAVLILLLNGAIAVLVLKDFNVFAFPIPWGVKYRFFYIVFEVIALWVSGAAGLLGFSHLFKFFKTNGQFCFQYKEIVFIITTYFMSVVLIIIAGFLEADLIAILITEK